MKHLWMWWALGSAVALGGLWMLADAVAATFSGHVEVSSRSGRVAIDLARTPEAFWYGVAWHVTIGVGLMVIGVRCLVHLRPK